MKSFEKNIDIGGLPFILKTNINPHELPDEELQLRLIMFVEMLKQIGNNRLEGTLSAFGLTEINGTYQFNQDQFHKYKSETLKKRVEDKGYVFFELLDQSGKILGIASGEEKSKLNEQENSFRLLNFYITPELQRKGLGTAFAKEIFISLTEHGLDFVEAPISIASQEKGNLVWIERLGKKSGIELRIKPESDQSVVICDLGQIKDKIIQQVPSPGPSSPRQHGNNAQQIQ
jgi:hypothetical protein